MTGNKGEWSELYALLKLLADGVLYGADADMNKMHAIFYNILSIIRKQTDDTWEYVRNGNIKVISQSAGEEILSVPIEDFRNNAELLLSALQSGNNESGAFDVPDVWDFARRIKCNTLKAKSTDKSDVIMFLHDSAIAQDIQLGFSIKSQLGSPSTLLNASTATNFIYKITGHNLNNTQITEFNEFKYFKNKFEYLDSLETRVEFLGLDSNIFNSNLTLVDTQLPKILSYIAECFYRGQANTIKDLTVLCEQSNICNINEQDIPLFYKYKVRELLTSIALGMVPNTRWQGNYEATGGYIIVKDDGDVLCYHIYNRNEFREYLFNNTKLDTPSKTRHQFGSIETINDGQFLKLNLQIRFIK